MTLSVPMTPGLSKKLDAIIESGVASNKADAARKAIEYFAQEQAIAAVLKAEKEVKEGKILRGDLDKLVEKL